MSTSVGMFICYSHSMDICGHFLSSAVSLSDLTFAVNS